MHGHAYTTAVALPPMSLETSPAPHPRPFRGRQRSPTSSDSLAGDEGHSTLLDTRLNKKWLGKTLREGLILPALESMKIDGGGDRIETIEIDGNGFVDGNAKGSIYVSPYGNTVTVTIRLKAVGA